MDRWGRPTFEDGMGLAHGLMQVKSFQNKQQDRALGLQDREKNLQSEANIEKYIPMIKQNVKPDRNAKDFNWSDWLSAQTKVQQTLNADVNYQTALLTKETKERTVNEAKINQMIATSEIYAGQGDDRKAAEILAPVYNYMPDNQEYIGVSPDNPLKWTMKDQGTNKEYTIDALSYGEAMGMAKKFSPAYRKISETFREKQKMHNNAEISKREIQTTPDGQRAYYFTFWDKTGAIRPVWKDTQTGEVVKGYDVRTGQNVESGLDFRSPEERKAELEKRKTEADIAYKEKQTKLLGKEGETPKEKRASTAKIKATDRKQLRVLKKELRKAKKEFAVMVEDQLPKNLPTYIQAENDIKAIEDEIRELKGGGKKKTEAEPKADKQIAEILKQNGFAVTPENIAKFKEQN